MHTIKTMIGSLYTKLIRKDESKDEEDSQEKENGFTICRAMNGKVIEITNSDKILLFNMLLDESRKIIFDESLPNKGEDGVIYVIKPTKYVYGIYTWDDENSQFIHRKNIESYL